MNIIIICSPKRKYMQDEEEKDTEVMNEMKKRPKSN